MDREAFPLSFGFAGFPVRASFTAVHRKECPAHPGFGVICRLDWCVSFWTAEDLISLLVQFKLREDFIRILPGKRCCHEVDVLLGGEFLIFSSAICPICNHCFRGIIVFLIDVILAELAVAVGVLLELDISDEAALFSDSLDDVC